MAAAMASPAVGSPLMTAVNSSSSTSVDGGRTPPSPQLSASIESSLDSSDESATVPITPTVKDPTVIVGMACRVPGASNPSQLWKNIAEKKDLQRKIPEDRFNVDAYYHPDGTNKGTTNARYGYFLDQPLDEFDNEFFRISGKEAESMDPQQRILLEVVYEALEDAGITLEEINGSQTSVFCGSFTNDYSSMTVKDLTQYPKYSVTGTGNAILSNRISFCYNLHGPSVTIDTACSSSLVCFHLGNTSLQNGESDISIVVGSALHFDPNIFITMTDFQMLSTDGRCRTYDRDGSGYVRGEGITAVVLKKRSTAELAGDTIKSIVRGTGANHDGTKEGLTLPNGEAQAQLLRSTYKAAGLSPADTQYFEAHGTGTQAGDPREAKAIGSFFAQDRDEPLYVGSIKSNVGHLEGASGIAGIIKATLSVDNGKILPNMHFNTPSPKIDFERLKIKVPTELIDWKSENGVRRASVNSFGYGGSNAHVILENYRPKPRAFHQKRLPPIGQADKRSFLVPLTSHNEDAGKLLVSKLGDYLRQNPYLKGADLSHSMSFKRSMHPCRSFAIGADAESILKDLTEPKPIAKWTKILEEKPRIGFVFTGQGAQWHAMGRQLIEQSPLFRKTLERCDSILQRLPDAPDWSCVTELLKSAEDSRLSQSRFSQPLCAALQLGIVGLLTTWGIEPSAVVGHSSGEIVAAYAAGSISFENSIICAYYRGLYMSKGTGSTVKGAMMAVGLTEFEGRAELKPYEGRIALAAINSPSSLTLSGDEDAIVELKQSLETRKVFARQLKVEQAFHSHHMVPLSPAFEKALSGTSGFRSENARVKFHSSVTARDSSARKVDAAYWAANMTGMVRFSDALTGIVLDDKDEQNIDVLIEIGAHPALKGPANQTMKSLNLKIPYLASLTREGGALDALLATAGQLFQLGHPVDLAAVNSSLSIDSKGRTTQVALGRKLQDLPSYAWKHGKFWAETRMIKENRLRPHRHTLLGAPIPGGIGNHPRWRNYLRKSEIPWLEQHVVDGKVIYPAAGYICQAIEAVVTLNPVFKEIKLRDVVIKSPLEISGTDRGSEIITDLQPLQTSAKNSSSKWYRFLLCSFDENHRTIEHCFGLICAEQGSPATVGTLDEAKNGFIRSQKYSNRSKAPAPYYRQLKEMGIDYSEDFQLISGDVESGPGFAMAPLKFKPANVISLPEDTCVLHPTFLDASLHVIFAAVETTQTGKALDETFLPTFIKNMTVSGLLNERRHASEEQNFWVKSDTVLPGARVAINHLSIQSDTSNDVLVDMSGFEVTALGNISAEEEVKRNLFFRIKWAPVFECLGRNERLPSFGSLAQVLDTYVHQFPDTKILHLTSSIDSAREALHGLGANGTEQRRFRSITPYSQLTSFLESRQELVDECRGLVDLGEPKTDDYDLVIISEPVKYNVTEFLKPDGFVISDGMDFNPYGMTEIFRDGKYSSYQKSTPEPATAEDLTIIVSSKISEKTQTLASEVEAKYSGKVTRMTIADVRNSVPSSHNILSLVSLDEDIFYEQTSDQSNRYREIQNLMKATGKNIIWVLEGATQESSNPAQAMMVGLARSVRSENEDLRLVTLDLYPNFEASSSSKRVVELFSTTLTEDEFAERDGLLQIPRFVVDDALNRKLPHGGQRQPRLEPFRQSRDLSLKIGRIGLLDTLVYEDDEVVADPHLAEDDVEIEVRASALNFRDVAAAMGIIDDYRLGDECAGVVKRTGRNVNESDFKAGDRVIAIRPGQGAHRSTVRNPAMLCQKIGSMDFVTATCFELVLATAYYALVDIARLQPGEYCLIHSAAGGVGQMAIQLAQRQGAKVIATVSSQAKRDFLKDNFGLEDDMIFSSRDPSFVQGVMRVTGGRGCDVALNQLAGELLHATWVCIAPFGRLVEIGKRDIHENTRLDMDPFRRNVMYASLDLITMFEVNKPILARLMRDCFDLVNDGKIRPPGPLTTVPYSQAQKGFRLLQMGKVFGKVVLVPGEKDIVPVAPPTYTNRALFNAAKSYLLVGGLGGIGRSLAEWMFRKGARKLGFLSRSGAKRDDAKDTVDWLKARGVEVSVFAGDVANYATVEECIQTLGDSLGGIFQAAMVLRDTPFADMTHEQWQTCVSPKVQGTYNLHRATTEHNINLDFFVGFSSASATVGAMAQANYAAANSYIDALMRLRRQQGLPGTTMNVGAVGGVGAVAEDEVLRKIMERIGYDTINEQELYYQIEEAVVAQSSPKQHAGGIDDHQLITGLNMSRKDLYWAAKPLFRNIYANLDLGANTTSAPGAVNLTKSLQNAANPEERATVLMTAFIDKIANVLSVPANTVQPGNPLSAYGLDSIVAVEFRKWFSKSVAVEVSLFDILGAKSIEALIAKVNGEIMSTAVEMPVASKTKAIVEDSKPVEGETDAKSKQTLAEELKLMRKPEKTPMSTFQNRIWFLHNMLEDQSSLNFVITSRIEGQPDLQLLQRALVETIRRNDILRTEYFEGDDFAEQAVREEITTEVQFLDVSRDPLPERALQRCAADLRSLPLDIESAEAMRFTLVKLADLRYAAVIVYHHVALDSGSTKSFMDQFSDLYGAFRNERDLSTVATPQITYADFTVWHNERMRSGQLKDDMAWWEEKLNGAVGANSLLPFARSQRPAKRSSARSILRETLDLTLLKRMKRVCARMNATPFQFILTAFRAFIHRYTQEDDLTILMIDGNRPHPDLEDVIGFFVNMVPLRCQNDCETSFDQLLGQVKETALEALAHSHVSFDNIVEAAKKDINPSHFPLGQIVVNYQMYGKPPIYKTDDYKVTDVGVEDIPTAVEMQLEATEDPQSGLKLRFEYDSFLYGSQDMDRFFGNFTTFIGSIVQDHLQPVDEIAMCGPRELEYLKTKCWAGTAQRNDWDNQSVTSKIIGFADTQPRKTAIVTSDGEQVNYADIVIEAQKIANSLTQAGAAPGQCVGILTQPGIGMVAAMLGAAFVRCGYVPLDPKFAKGRLVHMIQDSSASIVLTGKGVEKLVAELKGAHGMTAQVIPIASVSSSPRFAMPKPASATDPFYVIYTSGSTGKPKGVVLTHENTQNMLSSHNKAHGFNPQDTILAHSSMSFDLSVAQIWGSLTSGATMALATASARQDPVQLARFMRTAAVTVTYIPATQFALLLEHNSEDLKQCLSYRQALFAGEYLPVHMVKAIYDLGTPVTVFNQWGPTETTAQTTYHKTSYPGPGDLNLPIGSPIKNNSHYVVDRRLNPVPASVVGELCIGGAQVGRGYLNRPEATAETFINDPFASDSFRTQGWEKLYRTGDKGRFLPNGEIDFKGRISGDKQIKIRGHRIDLAETENEIFNTAQHLDGQKLVDVVVLPCEPPHSDPGMTDNRRLIAFVVLHKACTQSEQQMVVNSIHKAISMPLNDYMLPNGYQFMNTLTSLVSAKHDKQMLMKSHHNLIYPTSGSDSTEQDRQGDHEFLTSVVEAFRSVLKIGHDREIAPTENFFQLGGQSILLLRLRAVLKRKLDADISLPDLFQSPTPLGIAQKVLGLPNEENQVALTSKANDHGIDWQNEAILPIDSRYQLKASIAPFPRSEIREIFITGVDSFAGGHMLATLLHDCPSTHFHVMGSEVELIPFDLSATFEQWQLFSDTVTEETLKSRTHCVPGTLTLPHLGLDDQTFQELGRSVQAIYHCGGQVSLLKSYHDLKRPNVGSTLDLVELAAYGNHRTEIHYLSTWSVLHLQSWSNTKRSSSDVKISETSPSHFEPGGGESLGYFKSRWVAEMLLNEAAKRGFPISIYRASAFTASSKGGVATPDDNFTHNMILGMIETGVVPDVNVAGPEYSVDFIPIDYLVGVLARLSTGDLAHTGDAAAAYYHIGNPNPLALKTLPTLMTKIRADGATGTLIPMSDWTAKMREQQNGNEEQAQIQWTVFKEFVDVGHMMFSLDRTSTKQALQSLSDEGELDCPAVDEVYLKGMISSQKKSVN